MPNTIKLTQKLLDMQIKVIKAEAEYEQACERVYELIHSTNEMLEPNSPKGEEVELLSLLIEDYEKRQNYKVPKIPPIEFIKLRMTERKLRNKDLVPSIGHKSQVSKILNGKRQLTLSMIKKLSKELDIPAEAFLY